MSEKRSKIKRRTISTRDEKIILTGMIVSDRVLQHIRPLYDSECFKGDYFKVVGNWCIDYLDKYHTAPKAHFQDMFEDNIESVGSDELKKSIADFLGQLSEAYEDTAANYNADYVIKKAQNFFKERSIKNLQLQLKQLMKEGKLQDASALLSKYSVPEFLTSNAITVFENPEDTKAAFEDVGIPLFKIPGALGQHMNDDLHRGCMIGILGRTKIGKSWWMMQFALWAHGNGRLNVALFQAGDMSEKQQLRRIGISLAGRSDQERYCGLVRWPVLDCAHNQNDECDHDKRACDFGIYTGQDQLSYEEATEDGYKPCTYCQRREPREFEPAHWFTEKELDPLTWAEAHEIGMKWTKRAGNNKHLKIAAYPNTTLTCAEIDNQLDIWEQSEGFIPDLVIVDMPDIMAKDNPNDDNRNAENTRWKGLRRINQERDNLIILLTQADKESANIPSLTLNNFSEDWRKYQHCTGFYALNQTPEEKDLGCCRVGTLLRREADFSPGVQVRVLQSLQRGKPYIASYVWTEDHDKKN